MIKKFFSGLSINIVLLGLVSLFTDLSSQAVFPLIPLYLTSVLGAGAFAVGLIEGAAETTASFFKVISGYLSDKLKKRKIFIQIGYTLSAITKPLFAFSSWWPFILFIRVIERFGKGVRNAPRDAFVAETVEIEKRGKAFGFQRSMDGFGSVLGALAAYWLLPVWGYEKIFIYAFLPGLLAIFFTLFIKEKKALQQPAALLPEKKVTFKGNIKELPINLKLFLIVIFIFTMGQFSYAFLMLKAKLLGATDDQTLFYYVLYYIMYTLLSIPFGILSDKIGRRKVLIMGFILFAMISIFLLFTSKLFWLIVLFVVLGIFFALTDGVQRAYVADLAPKNLKATALGAYHSAVGLAALPGGYLAGILWDKVNPQATFIFGLVLSLFALIIFLLIKQPKYANAQN